MNRRHFMGAAATALAFAQLPASGQVVGEASAKTLLQHILAGTNPIGTMWASFATSASTLWARGRETVVRGARLSEYRFDDIPIAAEILVIGSQITHGAGKVVAQETYPVPRVVRAGDTLSTSLWVSII